MNELQLPICSVFFSMLLIIIYFSKKRVNLLENKIYAAMIILGLADSIIVSLERIIVMDGVLANVTNLENFILQITNKIDFIILISISTCLFLYTLLISFNFSKKIFIKILNFILFVDLIAFFSIGFLGVNLISKCGIISVNGSAVVPTYALCGFYLVLSIVISLSQIKKITKRHIPILSVFVLLILLLVVYQKNPYIMINSIVITFINYLMYHTIENPDLRMINELNLAKENANRANKAKTDFLSSMSHEIRTPLNAIVGFSNAILEEKTLNDAKEDAKDIIMASNNLLEIVNGILDISKIEANKMEIFEVNYNLKKIVKEIEKLIKPRLNEKPIEFKIKLSPDIPDILYGDIGKIKEIVTNLLINATKYTEKGTIELSIMCVNILNKSKLIISVEDTGRGIKSDKIDKLFTKFQRLEEDRNTTLEGTGLGLAITKSLTEMMGGKIVVQSTYGEGSKFTVYLSQKIVSIKERELIDEVTISKEEIVFDNKKILVVDDNKLNLKVATKLLENYKINIDTCLSGIEAIEKLKTNNYNLILLDDMMPKLTGKGTLIELKKNKDFKIPVVVLTANAISGMREKYLELGFDDYLAKPIEKEELSRILNKFL